MAQKHANFDMMIWLLENGCSNYDNRQCPDAMINAVANGSIDVLEYLRKNGCDWNETACYAAAAHNQLDTLKYLHENGCPWDDTTFCVAAKCGHIDVLKYLHENGCPKQLYDSDFDNLSIIKAKYATKSKSCTLF